MVLCSKRKGSRARHRNWLIAPTIIGLLGAACNFDQTVPIVEPADLNANSDGGANTELPVDATPTQVRYRQELGFSFTPVAADLLDFPVLVVLDSSRIDYGLVQDLGQDLRFTDPATQASLPHEIELWNEEGRSFVWVKVPRIRVDGASSIWMSYGDPAAEDGQSPSEVWMDDFAAVWHLNETIVGEGLLPDSHRDSTSGGNHADHVGTTSIADATSLGRAQSFDGIDDHLEILSSSVQGTREALTLSARARPTGEPHTWPHVIGAGDDGRHWQIFWDSGIGWVDRYRVDGVYRENWTSTGTFGQWNSLSSVYDGDSVRLYVDGVEVATTPATGGTGLLDSLPTPIYIGGNPGLSPREFQGDIDEVRISTVARSADWIRAEHLCNSDSLLVFGISQEL